MNHVLLIQLPVPQINFGFQTGNIPLGAACLKQAAAHVPDMQVDILPQAVASYIGDAALLDHLLTQRPGIIGFTCYFWNIQRVLYLCREIKKSYTPRIVLGGPEITPDNRAISEDAVDLYAYGEGEDLFGALLENPALWSGPMAQGQGAAAFVRAPNPYLTIPLSPDLENTMLLETMRGCPYACAYCYYNKSNARMAFKADGLVLDAVVWALEHQVKQIYLLDPSLNSRPGLKNLLKQIAAINPDRQLSFISEIRVEAIDDELADLLAAAGFTWLEAGLQSTNPAALKAMRRHTNLTKFVEGARRLLDRNITPAVDLIAGLPGDDLKGFKTTVDFVSDNGLYQDIQVFPLSLIPGTEFRLKHESLGLVYDPTPPYRVISTPTFSSEDMLAAFDLAESRFDISIYPLPDLDAAYKIRPQDNVTHMEDIRVQLEDLTLVNKVVLRKDRSPLDLQAIARQVTYPFQLLVPPATGMEAVARAITIFTEANPYGCLEVVFYAPAQLPDADYLLKFAKLKRPHYLDNDFRMMYPEPGNRAILFTVVSEDLGRAFAGPMQRHVFWWKQNGLPSKEDLMRLEGKGFDGILIDPPDGTDPIYGWQDEMAKMADDLMLISFAFTHLHQRWMGMTKGEHYCLQVMP